MNPTLPSFLPNFLSILRILIGFAFPFLLIGPLSFRGWALGTAFFLFVAGALTDFWDGWIARRHQLETPLGRILDPTADKLFLLSAMACFAAGGLYSHWWLVPIFIREATVTFCRIAWLLEGRAVGAERAGKIKLGFQVASVSFSFLCLLFFPTPVAFRLNDFVLILTMLVTVVSGVTFLMHNRNLLAGSEFAQKAASLGVGFLPVAPGTWGSLAGLGIVFLVTYDPWLHLLTLAVFIALTYWAVPRMKLEEGEDPPQVVIDECCGILAAFLAIPLSFSSAVVGFCLFRLFDVTKPFPLRRLERQRGTHGILWDDLGAGVYSWLILRMIYT